MIAYLPDIYPDELVYSWFCRYYVHAGCFTHKMALQELYCNRSDNPSKEFIGNLKPEARMEIAKMYPMDVLTLKHTMFPQYARFIPLAERKKALYHIGYDSCDIHHLFCVLPRSDEEQYLRYCPLCVAEDRKQYGETYWHRKHQLRNVNMCTKHRCRLTATAIPIKSEQNYTFYPAENVIRDSAVMYEENPTAIRFAAYVEGVFDASMDFENDIPVSSVLYDGMSKTKYLKHSGRSRYTKQLADDIKGFYEKLGLCSVASMCQIQRVLLGERFEFSVVCQIAFFLWMSINELLVPKLTMEQIRKEQESHYVKNAAPVDWERLDMETAPILEEAVRGIYDGTLSESGRPERVSERMVYRKLGLKAHQLEKMPRCRAVFEKYSESYPESWARKVIWAYRKLEEEERQIYWTDIRRLSGVKKENMGEIVPYLEKYGSEDIIKWIDYARIEVENHNNREMHDISLC